MQDPVLVEAMRGPLVESRHAGAAAVADVDGRLLLSLGDVARPVYPRSAVKAIQALPLIETGAADRFRLDDEEIALACASHSGAPRHVAVASAMLRKAGRDETCLACGAHWPIDAGAARALAAQGAAPTQLHNNCSGKHAGFICLSAELRADPAGYVAPAHPVQRAARAALEDLLRETLSDAASAIDGCSIPTYAAPLCAFARAFARFGAGAGLAADRAAAAQRIRFAVARHPDLVAGAGRFDTIIMAALGERVFVKTGAEGVHVAALPELGIGVAVKCADGAGRAAEVAMATVLAALSPPPHAALERAMRPPIHNWKGVEVGGLRPSPEFQSALAGLSAVAR